MIILNRNSISSVEWKIRYFNNEIWNLYGKYEIWRKCIVSIRRNMPDSIFELREL